MKFTWPIIFVVVLLLGTVELKKCCKKISKKYFFTKTKVNNEEAHQLCARNGMRLASIQSEQEERFFAEGINLNVNEFWIWIAGKVEPEREPPYLWMWNYGDDLVSRQIMNHTSWSNSRLPNLKETGREKHVCVASAKNGRDWVNFRCDGKFFAACETLN